MSTQKLNNNGNSRKSIPVMIATIIICVLTHLGLTLYYKSQPTFTVDKENDIFMSLQFRGMASKFGTFSALDPNGKIVHIYPSSSSYKFLSGYRSKSLECFKVTERIYKSEQTDETQQQLILNKFNKLTNKECNTNRKDLTT